MRNIIKIIDIKGIDPIIRKGDLVRLESLPTLDSEEEEFAHQCLGYCGFVTGVQSRYGEDSDAPNQAAIFSVSFPFDDGWEEINDVEIFNIVRIISKDLDNEIKLSEIEEINGDE